MSPFAKYKLLLFLVFPLGFVAIVAMILFWSNWFGWMIFPWAIFIQLISERIKCPRCGTSVGKRKWTILNKRFLWWNPFGGKVCANCGAPLDTLGPSYGSIHR